MPSSITPPVWTRLDSAQQMASESSRRILLSAEKAIQARGRFSLVLTGGTTPEMTHKILAKASAEWDKWHIYFGDERCRPRDHAERNSLMAARTLTDLVPIPASQIHPIPAELGAEIAAREYAKLIRDILPFDMLLLGMGPDGHVGSLFPGVTHPDDALVVPVFDSPKPPAERVSLNYAALGNSREVLYLISGSGKQEAARRWRNGEKLPAACVPFRGSAEVLCDFSLDLEQTG